MKRRGLTQIELAAKTGVTQAAISKWLNGTVPKGDQLLALAGSLGVTMEWLLTREEDHTSVTQKAEAIHRTSTLREQEGRQIANELENLAKRLRLLFGS
jgi:transcriptional regulator with XRE-family HTH domain